MVKQIVMCLVGLCGVVFSSCAGQTVSGASSVAPGLTDTLPHCAEDRRPSYTVLEMPHILNRGNAPQAYLDALYDATRKQVEKRAVWQVVQEHGSKDEVVMFKIAMLSWKNDPDSPNQKRLMEMNLSLVDKLHGCEVNETGGQGQVDVDASGQVLGSGIADVADGAGWFVENVLLHNPSN